MNLLVHKRCRATLSRFDHHIFSLSERGPECVPAALRPELFYRSFGCRRRRRIRWMWRTPKQDACFHLHQLPVPQVWPELPLFQSVGDNFCLVGKGTEKMDVLYLAFLIDDDPNRNGVEITLGKDRLNSLNQIFSIGITFDANRDIS